MNAGPAEIEAEIHRLLEQARSVGDEQECAVLTGGLGDLAFQAHDWRGARAYYDEALRTLDPASGYYGAFHGDRGGARAQLHDLDGACADLAVAIERAERDGDQPHLLIWLDNLAQIRRQQGRVAESNQLRERADRLRSEVAAEDEDLEGRYQDLAVRFEAGDVDEQLHDALIDLHEAFAERDSPHCVAVLGLLALVKYRLGDRDDAIELAYEVHDLFVELGGRVAAAQSLVNIGGMAVLDGELVQARAIMTDARDKLVAAGAPAAAAIAERNIALIDLRSGLPQGVSPDVAVEEERVAPTDGAAAFENPAVAASDLATRGVRELVVGRLDEAVALLTRAHDIWCEIGMRYQAHGALYTIATAQIDAGRFDEAERLLDRLDPRVDPTLAGAITVAEAEADVDCARGFIAIARGHHREAERLLRDAAARFAQLDNENKASVARARLGAALVRGGAESPERAEEGLRELVAARTGFRAVGAHGDAVRADLEYALALRGLGRPTAAFDVAVSTLLDIDETRYDLVVARDRDSWRERHGVAQTLVLDLADELGDPRRAAELMEFLRANARPADVDVADRGAVDRPDPISRLSSFGGGDPDPGPATDLAAATQSPSVQWDGVLTLLDTGDPSRMRIAAPPPILMPWGPLLAGYLQPSADAGEPMAWDVQIAFR
ncbi:hypothetical protein [Skermania piniformis]|uniref:Tetratricopeptide repeat protein n=1 Tax=Skermania pinensis TaxID=39122 RepID=A0ABX8SD29_9ACTN|nr:hypothetical protein [Skermania piniformis]QXQ15326.1 hypothetical protein KV203_08455 [Skermania piniformis]